jgi:hypothetical protein
MSSRLGLWMSAADNARCCIPPKLTRIILLERPEACHIQQLVRGTGNRAAADPGTQSEEHVFRIDRHGISTGDWNTIPVSRRGPVTKSPSISILPAVTGAIANRHQKRALAATAGAQYRNKLGARHLDCDRMDGIDILAPGLVSLADAANANVQRGQRVR